MSLDVMKQENMRSIFAKLSGIDSTTYFEKHRQIKECRMIVDPLKAQKLNNTRWTSKSLEIMTES